mmetsp:Transcript_28883/g.94026  ORF Transcript_28883/g.94026 Transcript_28883/m.94026 type:complete len:257 (-) Transcript_28883:607-1377(-)
MSCTVLRDTAWSTSERVGNRRSHSPHLRVGPLSSAVRTCTVRTESPAPRDTPDADSASASVWAAKSVADPSPPDPNARTCWCTAARDSTRPTSESGGARFLSAVPPAAAAGPTLAAPATRSTRLLARGLLNPKVPSGGPRARAAANPPPSVEDAGTTPAIKDAALANPPSPTPLLREASARALVLVLVPVPLLVPTPVPVPVCAPGSTRIERMRRRRSENTMPATRTGAVAGSERRSVSRGGCAGWRPRCHVPRWC